ncbi:GtrA family protein [Methylomonas sp. MO1]|uniref:GtrA family protein n=1 Tax=unclassified Methylomonas TaxID=2608980 RepID=UPI00047BC669
MGSITKRFWGNEKIRYLFVGLYNTAFGYGFFAVIWFFLHHDLHYVGLLIISHFVSVINAYLGYRIYVFRVKGRWLKEFFRFNMVYLGAFGFNLIALPLLVERLNLHTLIAQAIIVSITVISSYILHRRFSFKKNSAQSKLS